MHCTWLFRPWSICTLTLLVAAVDASATTADYTKHAHGVPVARVPGRALLKLNGISGQQLRQSKSSDAAASALKQLSARTGVDVSLVRPLVLGWALVDVRAPGQLDVPTEAQTATLVTQLKRDAAVANVHEDKWLKPLAVPNDPGYSQMWHLDVIGAPAAWDITKGTSSQRIGVVDTGLLRAHEEFAGRAVAGYDFLSIDNNDGNGRDADFNDVGDSCEASFHGTHTAGTIAAATNNGIGIPGLNWNAGLVIGRALGDCGGSLSDIGEASAWMAGAAVDNVPAIGSNKVSVINLSLGGTGACSGFEQDVVNFVNDNGAIFVAAAGNDAGPVNSPGNCAGALAVAAHGPSLARSSYSSFGSEIDIVGPGGEQGPFEDGVLSSVGPGNNDYSFYQGTSMATPHVAGAISLLQVLDPTLTEPELVTLLQSTGVTCSGCSGKPAMQLHAALVALGGDAGPTPVDPVDPVDPPPTPTADDAFEENDTQQTASDALSCGVSRSDLVALPGDQDWFVVTAAEGATIDVDLNSNNGADLDLYAVSATSAEIAKSETTSGIEAVSFAAPGAFYVVVNPYEGGATSNAGPYTLSISCNGSAPVDVTPPDNGTTDPSDPADPIDPGNPDDPVGPNPDASDDAFEDNDNGGAAAQLSCNEEVSLSLTDDDFFRVSVKGGALEAVIHAGALPITARILSLNETVLAEGDGTSFARAKDLVDGDYLIAVSKLAANGNYRLKAVCTPTQTFQLKANNCAQSDGAMAGVWLALVAMLRVRRRRHVQSELMG